MPYEKCSRLSKAWCLMCSWHVHCPCDMDLVCGVGLKGLVRFAVTEDFSKQNVSQILHGPVVENFEKIIVWKLNSTGSGLDFLIAFLASSYVPMMMHCGSRRAKGSRVQRGRCLLSSPSFSINRKSGRKTFVALIAMSCVWRVSRVALVMVNRTTTLKTSRPDTVRPAANRKSTPKLERFKLLLGGIVGHPIGFSGGNLKSIIMAGVWAIFMKRGAMDDEAFCVGQSVRQLRFPGLIMGPEIGDEFLSGAEFQCENWGGLCM